jgi:hypothetical protein
MYEDVALDGVARAREATFDRSRRVTHEAVWQRWRVLMQARAEL